MKVWTNNEFAGHWPVGTAAVVVADTAEEAADHLNAELKDEGLSCKPEQFQALPMMRGIVRVLCNGDY